MSSLPKVRCRLIEESDLGAVADLLTRGFPSRTRKYWTNALARLAARATPEGCPRFGYMLDAEGAAAGVLLLIFSQTGDADGPIRCNVSSWYVDPLYRGFAAALVSTALKLKHVTYLNISAAPHTWPILKAQGYSRYSDGQFAAVPLLSTGSHRHRARLFTGGERDRALPEYELMRAHAEAGCLAIVCDTEAGPLPFLFLRRRLSKAPFGFAQLVYCRDTQDLVSCAGALGRRLLLSGALCVICDCTAPIPGLAGRFFANKTPRYFRGPNRPRLNDLSFTELVLFGP
jgi:hypothetical protein